MRTTTLYVLWLTGCTEAPTDAERRDTNAPQEELYVAAGPNAYVEVGVELELAGTGPESASFEWDFGDGATGEGLSVRHTWTEPGAYSVVLVATGSDGAWRSDGLTVVVHEPLLPTRPIWSSTIAVSPDGSSIYAVAPEADEVVALNTRSGDRDWAVDCGRPVSISVSPSGLIGAACSDDASILVISPSGTPLWSYPFSDSLQLGGIVATGDDGWAISLPDSGSVATLREGEEAAYYSVGPDPRGLAWVDTPTGERLFTTRWRSGPTAGEVYELGGDTITLALDDRGDSDTTSGGVPNLLEQVVPTPDGSSLFLPVTHSNILRGSWRTGEALRPDATLRAVLASVDIHETADVMEHRKHFDDRGRANAVTPSPSGDRLYVVHTATGTVSIVDRWSQDLVGSILEVGNAPTGAALSPDGETLYLNVWLDRQVRAYDVSQNPPQLVGSWALVMEEPLTAQVLEGKRIFWSASDPRITRAGYIACAHCHPYGDHDGQVWDFTGRGEGLRNTPSLLGTSGPDGGPLHWTGNFDEVQDFEHDFRDSFGGTGFLTDEDWEVSGSPLGEKKAGRSAELDALAAYVATLVSPRPSPHAADDDDAEAFAAAGCIHCHPAPSYTDSSLSTMLRHDIGTAQPWSGSRLGEPLDGFDTPSLLGVWASAPYLHDGSAADLRSAITAHTDSAQLDPEVLDRIERFVRAL